MNPETTSIGQQIERLTLEAAGRTVEIGGRLYATSPVHDPRKAEPEPAPLGLSTLESLVEYVKGRIDAGYIDARKAFVHIVDPATVRLCSGIFGEFNQRATVAKVSAVLPAICFQQFVDPETFNIMLLATFEENEGRADVQQLVGNLTTEGVKTLADDGVSQVATARTGIVQRATVKVKNPHLLKPYRTFSEVAQVESPFILRLRGGSADTLPTVALFECDGGRWRLEATERIKKHLVAALGDLVPVYG